MSRGARCRTLRAIDACLRPQLPWPRDARRHAADAKSADTAAFLDRHRISFPNVFYTGNADELGDRLRFSGEIPVTIVFDRKGNELWRHQGRLDREKTIARLRETLRRMQ